MPEESVSPRVSPSPSDYREKNPYEPPPPDYKPPSMLSEYRWLAICFAALSIAFAVYCLKGPVRPRNVPRAPSAAAPGAGVSAAQSPAAGSPAASSAPGQPIYIEALPEKDAR